MAVGRISGPLLSQNLFRDNVPLGFYNTSSSDAPVLYLDVTNGFVGIKNSAPNYELDVSGTINASALRISYSGTGTGFANIGNLNISGSTISTTVGSFTVKTSAGDQFIVEASPTRITDTTQSTSTTTGALVVDGGVGIAKNLNVGGITNITANVPSTTNTNGSLVVQGGVGITGDLNVGGVIFGSAFSATISVTSQRAESIDIHNIDAGLKYPILASTTTGFNPVDSNNNFTFQVDTGTFGSPLITVTSSTESVSPITGALTIVGGVGIGGKLYVANTTTITSTENSISTTTGALVVDGGAGIGGNLNVGGNIHATGNITADGNIQLGNNTSTDTLVVDAEIDSDLIPKVDNTYNLGSQSNTWANAYLEKIYTKVLGSQTGPITINPANNLLEINADIKVNGNRPFGTAPVVTNVLYVTMDGLDTNDGRAQDASRACRTIGGALRSPYYTPGTSIKVAPGHYFENNPLVMQPYTSIIGSDLRTTSIEPINKTQDLFHVQSGCYLAQMQFVNGRSGLLPGNYAPGYNRGAYAVAFPPQVGGTKIDVFHSPYVQNCTNQSGPWLVDGTYFVPNQTIQIPLAVGTGTWIANTTTIVVTVSTGTITTGMSINPGQQDPGFFNARTLLLANKQFIQEQVVGYVNSVYPTFVYSQAKCYRDVGIILENVVYDSTFGGNEKTVESGLSYYNGVTSVIAGQETQTIAAIDYINTLSQYIITNSVAPVIVSGSAQVINTALTGGAIASASILSNLNTITNIINYGPSVAPSVYKSSGPDNSFVSAEILMQANRTFIQADTLAWISNNYPTFVYNTSTCYRDVGLIVDAVSQDILLGGNTKTIEAGLSYWKGGYAQILGQETTTTQAINHARDISLQIIANQTVSSQAGNGVSQIINTYFSNGSVAASAVTRNFGIINTIIVDGPELAPPVYQGGGLFAITGINADDVKIAPTVSSVSTISGNTYSITLSTSTVGFGTNATLYFGETAVFPLPDSAVPDQWAQRRIDPIGAMGGSLVDGGVVSDRSPIASFVYDAYTQVNQGGRGIHIINNGYAQLVSVFTIFCSTAVEVDSGGIASITNSNSNFGDKCLIAKGYGGRDFSGTIYNPPYPSFVVNGQYYPNGYWPQNGQVLIYVPDSANRPHIALIMEVEPPVGYVNSYGYSGFVTAAFNTSTLSTGSITISGIDTTDIAIGQTIYVRDQYGRSIDENGNPYLTTGTVVTNIDYREITLNKSINQGGGDDTNSNYFTLYSCGNAYYTVLSSTVYENPVPVGSSLIPGISGAEIIALNFISTLTSYVISNNVPPVSYSTLTQTTLNINGSGATPFIVDRIGIIKTIIENGVSSAPAILTTGTAVSNAGNAISLINSNIEYITQETVEYLHDLYPGVEYDRTTCARDIGLIVDSLAQDLLFNGTSQSTFTGLQYWNQNGYTGIIGTELTTTTNAINYVSSLAQSIVQNITTGTRYQGWISQVTNITTATASEALTIAADFGVITGIINNGTAGVTDGIIPNSLTSSTSVDVWHAYSLLQANKTYIQAEGLAYVESTKTPGFVYNTSTCYRDIGYMVDSVSFDLLYGGNRQAVQSGVYYYSFSTSTAAVAVDEKSQVTAAKDYLKQLVPYIVNGVTTSTYQYDVDQVVNLSTGTNTEAGIVQTLVSTITNIIQNGPTVVGAKAPIGLTRSTSTNVINAATILEANIPFLKAELIAYIDSIYNLGFNKTKCARDVRLLLQQLIYDLETGGNYYSVYSGLSYWSRAGTYHLVQLGENVRDPGVMPDGSTVNFYQRSYISASGYTFEYVGAGTNYGSLPQVGSADPVQGKEVIQIDNGKVFYTSTDQGGDFRIGPELVISQATGVLSGRTFTKSLFANLTPFILALEVGGV